MHVPLIGWLLVVLIPVTLGFFSALLAREKGYNSRAWFALGFIFNIVALVAVAGLPDRREKKAQ